MSTLSHCVVNASSPTGTSPNVLLIVADDLGYSDLGCFGGEIETPRLDRLAADGVRWTQFHSTARCCPSRASLLTGHYPHRVGLGHMTQDIGRPGYRGRVDRNAPTIAAVLKNRSTMRTFPEVKGYRCFLSGKWHLGTDDPTRHGFESFYGTLVSAKTFWQRDHYIQIPKPDSTTEKLGGETFYGTDALTDRAIDCLKAARQTPDQPWFIYLAYNAPHFPLQARREDIAKYQDVYSVGWDVIRSRRIDRMKRLGIIPPDTSLSQRSQWWNYGEVDSGVNPEWDSLPSDRREDLSRRMAIYAAMIDRMDQGIGKVVDSLNEHGELDNTLILFSSDNGACAEWDPFGFDIQSSNQNILHRSNGVAAGSVAQAKVTIDSMGGPGTFHSVGSGWANASNTPFRLYKHFCHQGGVMSPLIMHWPDGLKRPAGSIEKTPAHLIDLLPTIAGAAGATYPDNHQGQKTDPLPGIDLIAHLNEVSSTNRARAIYLEHEGNRGVRLDKWKLVALRDRPWELYDLSSDPIESNDLSGQYPEVVERLAAMWDRWAAENDVTPLPDDYQVKYLKPR